MKRIMLSLACLGLLGCAANAPVTFETQRFDQIVHTLADPSTQGRGAGSSGLDQARDYLVTQFQLAGLSPGFANDSYTQAIEISLGVKVAQQTLTWFAGDQENPLNAGRAADFNVLGFSASNSFRGQGVFAGYAITSQEHDYDSLDGVDDALQGHVAIAYRYEPMDEDRRSQWSQDKRWTNAATLTAKAQWAQQHGAVALLLVNPPSQDGGGPLRSTRETSFDKNVDIPVFHMRSNTFAKILEASGRDAEVAMRAYEKSADAGEGRADVLDINIAGEAAITRREATIHNVAAIVPGSGELANQTIVIGGHYDHLGFGPLGSFTGGDALHPGADDNASGTAAVVMLGARWMQRIKNNPRTDRRTLVFIAFSGEERGLLGSAYLVKHPDELGFDLSRTAAMLNFDMIGRMRDDALYVMGGGSGTQWSTLLTRANRTTQLTLRKSDSPIGPSDHTQFYFTGIPVLHFFTGVHENYHRPSDTPDRINPTGGAKVIDLADALLGELVEGEPVTYIEIAQAHTSHTAPEGAGDASGGTSGGGGAYLGIMPDYISLDGEQGCRIDRVMPQSPAEAAGLEAGDTIVQWNQQTIDNLQQLSDALREAKPDDEITLIVQRNNDTHTIPVTLSQS